MPRNGSGVYSLPSGNPVSPGAVIQSTWANNTMTDIADAITGSLARDGSGGMTGAFKIADGTSMLPSLSFTNEPSSGIYRSGAGVWWGIAQTSPVYSVSSVGLTLASGKVLQLQSGTVTAPAVTFSSDNNTGMWSPAADTIAFSTNGVERVRVADSAVTLTGVTFNADAAAITGGTINGTTIGATTAAAGKFTNLTATALNSLVLNGTTGTYATLQYNGSPVADWGTGNNIISGVSGNALGLATRGSDPIVFGIAATEKMRLDGSGNLGIGTTSPATYSGFTTLDIDNATNGGLLNIKKNGTTVGYINGQNAMLILGNSTEVRLNATDTNPVTFWANGSERARVHTDGNFGIGTNAPSQKLHVNGTSLITGKNYIGTTSVFLDYNGGGLDFGTSGLTKMSLSSAGVLDVPGGITLASIPSITPAKLTQPFTSGTAAATTSGTSVNFTSIPSWVKRITFIFNGVSTNGSSAILLQLGSGSYTTSGYTSNVVAGGTFYSNTTGFLLTGVNAASETYVGTYTLTLLTGNTWVATVNGVAVGARAFTGAGSLALSGTLDRLRIMTANTIDQFDAGTVNIMYE